jgi:hypothetical protein
LRANDKRLQGCTKTLLKSAYALQLIAIGRNFDPQISTLRCLYVAAFLIRNSSNKGCQYYYDTLGSKWLFQQRILALRDFGETLFALEGAFHGVVFWSDRLRREPTGRGLEDFPGQAAIY